MEQWKLLPVIPSAVNVTATGIVSFGTLTDSGESIAVTKFVDESDGIGSNDNDTRFNTRQLKTMLMSH